MKKNDIITLEITDISSEGSGVGRYEGMAVFVPFSAKGDKISARVLKINKSFCYAKIEEILSPSPDRTENDCPAFGKCGGCAFRHISYEAECRAKEEIVKSAFLRIGKLSPEFLPIVKSEVAARYRNKLQMPVGSGEGGLFCGFFAQRSHRIVPVSDCKLQPEIFSDITGFIIKSAKTLGISAYNEEKHEGVFRHIYLRKAANLDNGGLCCVLVARRKTPEFSKLAAMIREKFPEISGVVLNINPEKTNVILGEKSIVLSGRAEISDVMRGVPVEISPESFYQVNTSAAENLYKSAEKFARLSGNETLLDLYCGIGSIGLSMAKSAKKLIGAEIVEKAVLNARENAKRAGALNAEFIAADAGEAAKTLFTRGELPDVILLDPPRKGCDEETLFYCAKMAPRRIVMISCDPATAARDCARLGELGYEARLARAHDLFPRTAHVECVILLEKSK